MFKVIRDDNTVMLESESLSVVMQWMMDKSNEYMRGHVTWFESEGEAETVITMCIAGVYYKIRKS
jgi:hypothetical protein